jgi:hypothetical protein
MKLSRLKPAVPKCWLFAVSGVMWSLVGLTMAVSGVGWLLDVKGVPSLAGAGAGAALAIVAAYLLFDGIARKNILRLRRLPDRECVFAFQAWKSYLVIAAMIALGAVLRRSALPVVYLSVIYLGIGGALFLGSLRYYRFMARLMSARRRHRPLRR